MLYKKFYSSAVMICLSLSVLSGCGSAAKSPTSDAATATATTAATATENVSKEKTKIVVWAMGEEAKKMDSIVVPFEEKTGYDVEIQAIPWGEAHNKLLTVVASKSGPDVIQMGTTWMPEFVEAEAFVDLTPYMDTYQNLKPDNFFEGSVATTQYDGKTFGAPLFADTRLLFYRTDVLSSVGYDAPPKTWDELKDVSAKLKARGENFYGMNWDLKEQSLIFMLANQAGAKYYGTEYDKNYNTPEFIESVEYLKSFVVAEESLLDASIEVVQGFKDEGMLPIFIGGPWMINVINDNAPEIAGKWATAILPKGKVNNDSILGGTNLTVFAHSKVKDASVEFIDFMSSKESQYNWFKATSTLPANKAVWAENKELSEDKLIIPFGEQLKTAKSMPLSPKFEEIAQIWILEFEKIYRGGADIKTTVEEFSTRATKIFEN